MSPLPVSFTILPFEMSGDPWGPLVEWLLHAVPEGIILLEGDLGAGKTTLVQEVAKKLGFTGSVLSPTYSLIAVYPDISMLHGDLYRIDNPRELAGLGLADHPSARIFLEWGERFYEVLSPCAALVRIQCLPDSPNRLAVCQIL